ncbi:GntR family transcriptional regulator [Ruegeria aquimaris]|uniref:GntR family transcriptional regulator n=1 Tax=Ruegeria aquimaris TaxID=2984333 RepID=A0ABT3AHM9_9RHOB|nr:GntR family transcriptional regulator [Ruegeria sp. XHP0148]MCV2887686.1 GntR family transcriptional regulator [Ruegeria sp. XHP0148]
MIKKQATNPAQADTKQPVHEQVYQTLRSMILFGELAPGQAVTIQGLTDSLGAGMTPVREAIRRLMSEGALMFQGNRRISVPVLTQEDLRQVIFVRKSIEAELARRAAHNMTPAAAEALEQLDLALDQAIETGDVGGYLRSNYDFHALLYTIADAPILTEMADRLWLRFGPSLRVVCGRFGTQNLPDRHKEMLDALRAKDAEGVARAMEQDVEQGMEQMLGVLSETEA